MFQKRFFKTVNALRLRINESTPVLLCTFFEVLIIRLFFNLRYGAESVQKSKNISQNFKLKLNLKRWILIHLQVPVPVLSFYTNAVNV
jgi:hypothetical protein